MLIRISLGMLAYVSISELFGESFKLYAFGLSMFFVLLPLADWLLYLPLRRRYKLVSHYMWYYPIIYVSVGATVVYMISGSGYYVVLFTANSLANFVHATFQTPQGLQWLAPFSWISISLYGNKLKIFSAEERKAFLAKKYEEYKERSKKRGRKDEMRTVDEELSDRRHSRGPKTIALLIVSLFWLFCFYLKS